MEIVQYLSEARDRFKDCSINQQLFRPSSDGSDPLPAWRELDELSRVIAYLTLGLKIRANVFVLEQGIVPGLTCKEIYDFFPEIRCRHLFICTSVDRASFEPCFENVMFVDRVGNIAVGSVSWMVNLKEKLTAINAKLGKKSLSDGRFDDADQIEYLD
jgi:hypothetical protein